MTSGLRANTVSRSWNGERIACGSPTDLPAHAAPARPDVLRARRAACPRAVRPAVHALYGFVRGRGRDRRRPAPDRLAGRAPRRPRRLGARARARPARRRAPRTRSSRRWSTRARATTSRCTSCRATWRRCASDCGPVRIASRRRARPLHGGHRPRPSGASWRRCSARPGDVHEDVARLGVAFQLTNFIRDVRESTGRWAGSTCPACPRTTCAAGPPPGAPASTSRRQVARARALFAETAARRPRPCRPRCAPASASPAPCTAASWTASSATTTTSSAARALDRWEAARAAAGPRRGAAPMTVRATKRGAERTTPGRRARRRPRLRRELRRAGGRPRAGRGGPGADVLVVDRYEIGERADVGLRRPDAVAARHGRRRRRSARSCRT